MATILRQSQCAENDMGWMFQLQPATVDTTAGNDKLMTNLDLVTDLICQMRITFDMGYHIPQTYCLLSLTRFNTERILLLES